MPLVRMARQISDPQEREQGVNTQHVRSRYTLKSSENESNYCYHKVVLNDYNLKYIIELNISRINIILIRRI